MHYMHYYVYMSRDPKGRGPLVREDMMKLVSALKLETYFEYSHVITAPSYWEARALYRKWCEAQGYTKPRGLWTPDQLFRLFSTGISGWPTVLKKALHDLEHSEVRPEGEDPYDVVVRLLFGHRLLPQESLVFMTWASEAGLLHRDDALTWYVHQVHTFLKEELPDKVA